MGPQELQRFLVKYASKVDKKRIISAVAHICNVHSIFMKAFPCLAARCNIFYA